MAGEQAGFQITGDNSGLIQAISASQSAMQSFFSEMTSSVGSIGGALEGLQSKFTQVFQFTGAAIAVEAFNKLGEVIEKVGGRAVQLSALSDIIGVNVEQMQALELAADESGVSMEKFAHGIEKISNLLTQAEQGSSKAIEKLNDLGITVEQIQNPQTNMATILQTLAERLRDTATHAETMKEIVLVLGPRFAEAAEALSKTDLSARAVGEAMQKLNGLNKEQIEDLRTLKGQWEELKTEMANTFAKGVIGAENFLGWLGRVAAASANALVAGETGGGGIAGQGDTSQTQIAAKQQAADQELAIARNKASEEQLLSTQVMDQELANLKTGMDAYKSGSAERLQLAREYAAEAKLRFGSDTVDVVVKANQDVVRETRAFNEEQKRLGEQLYAGWDETYAKITAAHARMLEEQLRQCERAQKEEERVENELTNFTLDLQKRVLDLKAKNLEQANALDRRIQEEWKQQWGGVFNGIESGFSGAISGMIQGTETFHQAMGRVLTSILDGFINMVVRMGAEWLANMIFQSAVQEKTARSGIAASAAEAGAAATASAAAIPVYGWVLAPAAGQGVYDATIAYESAVPAAAQGYDIPRGINPLTQLHEQEMVLPANLAEGIRGMIGGGGQGAAPIVHNFHISALDGDSVHGWLKSGGAKILSEAVRRHHVMARP